jgi:hypothetical protein
MYYSKSNGSFFIDVYYRSFGSWIAQPKELISQQIDINTVVNNYYNTEMNSMLRFDNGNSSFVFPYKFKVKVPKFKTPTPGSN